MKADIHLHGKPAEKKTAEKKTVEKKTVEKKAEIV